MTSWVGSLVQRKGNPSMRWRVLSRNTQVDTLIIEDWEGTCLEIINQDSDYEVVADPVHNWPFVSRPTRQSDPIVEILRSSYGKLRSLEPMYDWVPTDRLSTAGSLYFNPALNIAAGDVLTAVHSSGFRTTIRITRTFGSLAQKRARVKAKGRKSQVSSWSRLGTVIDDED